MLDRLPDIDQWTVTTSTINADTMAQNTRSVILDILDDFHRGGMITLSDTERGASLLDTVYGMLHSTTMIGYDSDCGEMLFADFPERLIGSAVCPGVGEWKPASETVVGKGMQESIARDGAEYYDAMAMGQITKRPLRFVDICYAHHRRIAQDVAWYLILKRLIMDGIFDPSEPISTETRMMLTLAMDSANKIVAARFPLVHHGVTGIPPGKQLIMRIHSLLDYVQASPSDAMLLSSGNGVVRMGVDIPYPCEYDVKYITMDRITPK